MTNLAPVFYDFEASDVEGYPIEIGWAFLDSETDTLVSESHLIRPAGEWKIKESWDKAAERLHRIPLAQIMREGRPVAEVAQRMNVALAGRELFSDAPEDKTWLRLLFAAAGLEPAFVTPKTDARVLISQAATDKGIDEAFLAQAQTLATELVPQRHRAEPDARRLAISWHMVVGGNLDITNAVAKELKNRAYPTS
jgi:hypothetical protein